MTIDNFRPKLFLDKLKKTYDPAMKIVGHYGTHVYERLITRN